MNWIGKIGATPAALLLMLIKVFIEGFYLRLLLKASILRFYYVGMTLG